MRLTRDTLGDFKNAQDPLQRDLSILQRAFDDLQAQLIAATERLAAVEAKTDTPNVIIAPNGRVTTFKQRNGDPALGFGGGIIVAPNSGLDGEGTVDRPLKGIVDDNSVSFNSSGQFQGILKKYEALGVAGSTYFGLATTPRLLIPSVTNKVLIPVQITFASKAVGTTGHSGAVTNGNTSWNLRWTTSAAGQLAYVTGANNLGWANGAGVGVTQRAFMTQYPYFNTTNPTITYSGAALYLSTGADMSDPGNAAVPLLSISLLYYEFDVSLV